jgi:hypoxia up-regulated 1
VSSHSDDVYDKKLIVCRLAAFDSSDKSRRTREEVLNSLEAFTYRARDYLEDESFIGASVAAVRTTLEEKLSAASDWIYSAGAEAGEKELKAKLKELEDIVNPVLSRKTEAIKRPEAVKELKDTIAHLKEVVTLVDSQIKTQSHDSSKSSEAEASKAAATPSSSPVDELDELEDDVASSAEPAEPEITEVPTIYTDDDLKRVQEMVAASQKWLDENEAKQEKLTATDDPAFTVKDLQAEKKRIDDVVMDMMMKKMRHFKPPAQKPKAKPKAKPKKDTKKSKKDSKKEATEEEKPATENGPSDEELQEALRQAGVKTDNIKLKNYGHKDEMEDEAGRKLKKLNIDKDATEEDIRKAIEDLTKDAGEKKHDEL